MSAQEYAVQFGKVRVNTAIGGSLRILTASQRISAFDCVLPFEIENKGQILQAISAYFFTQTRDIIANHFVACLDAQSMLVRSGRVLPLEVIVRATLSGSLWRAYSSGGAAEVARSFGIDLPAGLKQHARFAAPVVTFTTKAAFGHDETVTFVQAIDHVDSWLRSNSHHEQTPSINAKELLAQVKDTAVKVFERGQQISHEAGLILLDTKYEFALDDSNQLMLVDELHTPDASRFVDLQQFNEGRIEHLSKEWLREIVQKELSDWEKTASAGDRNQPFVLRSFWDHNNLHGRLAEGLARQYQNLFSRFFPQLTPWDVIAPHLQPWPVDPVTVRQSESAQRLPASILVIGNGGRDYTIASCIERAAEVDVVYCWPGRDSWSGGKKASLGKISEEQLIAFCQKENIGWAVFGPEIQIAQGLAEKLRAKNIPCLAPDLQGAMLESSKIHTKNILRRSGCPTAESWTLGWSELSSLSQSNASHPVLDEYPYVLKYESLAAGKGVCLVRNAQERSEALAHFRENLPAWTQELATLAVDTFSKRQGEPQFLVEKLIDGKEISAIALCNGEDFLLLPYAQDFKRRDDGQTGPNTGGMGSVCPVPISEKLDGQIVSVFKKTLKQLADDGHPYRGFLFAGLMVDDTDSAQVLEYNCRLGDPETQVILPSLGRDFLLSMWMTSRNMPWPRSLQQLGRFRHDGLNRCFVVVASPEYPNAAAPKRTLKLPSQWPLGCEWIPSGVDSGAATSAGRIGGVLCSAETEKKAVEGAYAGVAQICFEGTPASAPHYRTDVCFPRLNKESLPQ